MALIEGFRVQNYRALRDVTLGKLSNQQSGKPLTPFTVVIGKNGVGKNTLFDAFGFVADCLANDEEAVEIEGEEDQAKTSVELTDMRQLGIATLGTLKEHPRIKRFRDFLKGWYLSYFYPDAARSLPTAEPQKHLNSRGDNIGNVVQFMVREHKDRFNAVLRRIAAKIPGIKSINTQETLDKRLLLCFNDGAFSDPFFSQQMSDGTLKVFAHLLLMDDPEPPPFICIEEPENGLYHKLP